MRVELEPMAVLDSKVQVNVGSVGIGQNHRVQAIEGGKHMIIGGSGYEKEIARVRRKGRNLSS